MADEVDEDNRCETTSVADPAKHTFYKKMLRKVRNPKASEKGLDSAEQLDGRLRIAARDGKVAEVRRLLVWGAQIKPDQNGCTAVHHASFVFWNVKSNIEIVTLLCEYGGHVNERDNLGQTALHKAVSNSLKRGLFDLETDSSNLEMIRKLVNLGADVNAEDSSGQTVLHVASMCRNIHNCYAVDELKLLVKMGCNMNVQDKQGRWEQLQNTPCYCSGIYCAHLSIERGMYSTKLTFKINSSWGVFCNLAGRCIIFSGLLISRGSFSKLA